jgi:hypothetical protein
MPLSGRWSVDAMAPRSLTLRPSRPLFVSHTTSRGRCSYGWQSGRRHRRSPAAWDAGGATTQPPEDEPLWDELVRLAELVAQSQREQLER